jgi:hypothetical protein
MDKLYKLYILKALNGKLNKTSDFFERKIMRWYSKAFSTPLHEVYNLPWLFVLQHYYESYLDDLEYDKVYDMAINDYLSELANIKEQEDEEFAKQLEAKIMKKLEKEKQEKEEKILEDCKDPEPEKPIIEIPDLPEINMNFEEEEYE